jgi:hypothetical protein
MGWRPNYLDRPGLLTFESDIRARRNYCLIHFDEDRRRRAHRQQKRATEAGDHDVASVAKTLQCFPAGHISKLDANVLLRRNVETSLIGSLLKNLAYVKVVHSYRIPALKR